MKNETNHENPKEFLNLGTMLNLQETRDIYKITTADIYKCLIIRHPHIEINMLESALQSTLKISEVLEIDIVTAHHHLRDISNIRSRSLTKREVSLIRKFMDTHNLSSYAISKVVDRSSTTITNAVLHGNVVKFSTIDILLNMPTNPKVKALYTPNPVTVDTMMTAHNNYKKLKKMIAEKYGPKNNTETRTLTAVELSLVSKRTFTEKEIVKLCGLEEECYGKQIS